MCLKSWRLAPESPTLRASGACAWTIYRWPSQLPVDAGRELVGVGVEESREVGVVALWPVGLEVEPGGVPSALPGASDVRRLLLFDGAWGEVVLGLGDIDPDHFGCALTLAIPEFWLDRSWGGWKPGDEVVPGLEVETPVLQGCAPSPVVHEVRGCV